MRVRRDADGQVQALTIPLHKELDRGTLHAIYRQASAFVPESLLHPRFYYD